jgi:UDP-N-acetyl-D-mannosaminuronate dehydrogenase
MVLVTDPLYEDDEIRHHGFTPGRLDSPAEVLILNTAHDAFANLEWEALASQGVQAVVDGRNVWPTERIRSAGIVSIGIGVPLPREGIAAA